MKTLPLFFLFLIATRFNTPPMVYICDSKSAAKYHYKQNCRGLSKCSQKIVKVTLEKAKKSGKTLCKWEVDPVKLTGDATVRQDTRPVKSLRRTVQR